MRDQGPTNMTRWKGNWELERAEQELSAAYAETRG